MLSAITSIWGFQVPIQYLLTSFCIFVALHSHQDEEESELGISRSLATTPRSPGRRKKSKSPVLTPHNTPTSWSPKKTLQSNFFLLSLSEYAHSIYFKYLTVEEEDMKRRFEIYIYSYMYIHISHTCICKNTKWIFLVKY